MEVFSSVKSLTDLKKITSDEQHLLTYEWSRNSNRTVAEAECCAGKAAVLRWYELLRSISSEYIEGLQATIGGNGMTVEIDESVVTKRKYNRGRVADNNQVWLIGGICRETHDIFLELVQKRDAATLHDIIMRHVAPGSTILTDGWRAYNGLENRGYSHAMVNHSENFVDPNDPFVHTQSIENLWRTHRGSLIKYLREYQLKRSGQNSFLNILRAIKDVQEFQ
uniref:DDE_Tnp_IS1595 domain-containing protein n=1 Tax=Anopheles maculatus TaxID=74869 RepID=A0A182SYA5_9DIPT